MAATVAAQRTGNPFAVIIGVLAWGGVIAGAIGAQLSIRRAKTLASAHLAATLGFPVRRACFSTPAGWRAFIERESRYHAQGYRPKFSISVGRKPGSPH